MRIAIQGIEGSFHHEAAELLFPSDRFELNCQRTFPDVFEAVENGEVHYGLVASENTLDGFIPQVYKQLNKRDIWIVKDLRMQIVQNLVGAAAVNLASLGDGSGLTVCSHKVALGQVEEWLDTRLPEAHIEERADTASSVREIVQSGNESMFAIAGMRAAATHGGKIIAEGIQDDPNNRTRFILFQKMHAPITEDATHGSLIIDTDNDKEGIIYDISGVFKRYGCSMTKLTSQPRNTEETSYRFFIDYLLNSSNGELLNEITEQGHHVRLLGYYASYIAKDGLVQKIGDN